MGVSLAAAMFLAASAILAPVDSALAASASSVSTARDAGRAPGTPPHIRIFASPALDAAAFLNAVSDEPLFSKGYEADQGYWLPRLRKDPRVWNAFQAWQGRGIALAYLLHGLKSDPSLPGVVRLLEDDGWEHSKSLLRSSNLDEPAYLSSLEYLQSHRSELRTFIDFVNSAGFQEYWAKRTLPGLNAEVDELQNELARQLGPAVLKTISQFAPKTREQSKVWDICVSYFSGPFNFALMNGGICLRHDINPEEAPPAVVHEWLHRFHPSDAVIALHQKLKEKDPFYSLAWKRIYEDHKEGEVEEFVIAAELYTSVRNGLRSRTEALRYVKTTYGGLPLAGLLYEDLDAAHPNGLQDKFDYDQYLKARLLALTAQEGGIQSAYARLIQPVSGIAGMKIERRDSLARVALVFPGFPAQQAGFEIGDVIEAIGATKTDGLPVARIIDLISGRPGDTFQIGILRDSNPRVLTLALAASPTTP